MSALLQLMFDGAVRCTRSADGNSMQLHGSGGSNDDIDLFLQGDSLPELPASLTDAQLQELAPPAAMSSCPPRQFELRSAQGRWQFTARAGQLHRASGRAMFAVIPSQPVPRWLRLAWWLLLSVLRLPGAGRLLGASRGAA
jgi:hypothetical protein